MRPTLSLALIVCSVGLAPSAAAQERTDAVRGWPGLDPSHLSTVYVLDDTGRETEGKLLGLNPDSLVLLVDGNERSFEAGRVRRIEKRGDSLRNGAIIGTIAGAVFGVVSAQLADCSIDRPGSSCPGARSALFLISTGMWAAIGTGIDAAIPGRTTLYDARTPPATGREGSARPRSSGRVAVSLKFRW
jgi:hypothetical protein